MKSYLTKQGFFKWN